MNKSLRALAAAAVAVPIILVSLIGGQAKAGSDKAEVTGPVSIKLDRAEARQSERAAADYWTPQRMAAAKPIDATYPVSEEDIAATSDASAPEGPPGVSSSSKGEGKAAFAATTGTADAEIGEPQHGTKPTNPANGPYGPFQRWALQSKYTTYPARTIGKLFFTLNGSGFVCSASTYGTDRVVTAGHCMSDGNGTFATSVTFCPAYNASGPNADYGCWDNWTGGTTSAAWHFNGDPDYDYASLTFGNDGTCNCLVGNRVGWMGVGWNWGTNQPDMSFGYPQGAPFTGSRIMQVASTDWYTHDFVGGGQISKVMGNDMTGGSSGGPWVLGWKHESAEIGDTDNSPTTDPAGPFVNGVNSHKRCLNSCFTPPTTTSGTFWQEMTSPPFEDTADNGDVRAILGL